MILRILPSLLTILCLPAAALMAPDRASCRFSDRAPGPSLIKSWPHVQSITEMITTEAITHGVPSHLAIGQAWKESRFDPKVEHRNTNGTVDRSVMQLNSRYHAQGSVQQNIHEGMLFLAEGVRRCGANGASYFYNRGHCR